MTPHIDDPDFTLHVGDALEVLRSMPEESVHCCVTSPPYWGLRDYGVEDQLGLEPTPDEYVANMVNVFREVRRVLRKDGTLWLNIGDSYFGAAGGYDPKYEPDDDDPKSFGGTKDAPVRTNQRQKRSAPQPHATLKTKDLCGIPWRLAFALQADGWYLRSDIIWSKPNPMPESVTDRPTKAHEYLFLLSKSPRYFYDADAIREPAEWARWGDQTNGKYEGKEGAASWIGPKPKSALTPPETSQPRTSLFVTSAVTPGTSKTASETCGDSPTDSSVSPALRGDRGTGQNNDRNDRGRGGFYETEARGRNKRSVWEIATEAYPDAHFATWPQALVERILKAGCPEQVCPQCGVAWERVVERGESDYARLKREQGHEWTDMDAAALERGVILKEGEGGQTRTSRGTVPSLRAAERTEQGWAPSCDCGAGDLSGVQHGHMDPVPGDGSLPVLQQHLASVPGVALDPFMGSGTTALVARRLGRRSIGIELNPEYAQLAARRLQQLSLFAVETAEA